MEKNDAGPSEIHHHPQQFLSSCQTGKEPTKQILKIHFDYETTVSTLAATTLSLLFPRPFLL